MLDSALTWAEIDLEAIDFNIHQFRNHVGARVEVMAVVKANAYGHGAIPVAQTALRAGASRLAVHRLQEGQELRQAGIQAPILLMGYTPPGGAGAVIAQRLTATAISADFVRALSGEALAGGVVQPVHIKVGEHPFQL